VPQRNAGDHDVVTFKRGARFAGNCLTKSLPLRHLPSNSGRSATLQHEKRETACLDVIRYIQQIATA
jgi:hypothetical protein